MPAHGEGPAGGTALSVSRRRSWCLRALPVAASCLLAAGATAQAGANYLEQTVKTTGVMGQPPTDSTQRIWIGDSAYCIQDEANGLVTVFDKSSGRLLLIQTQQKRYSEMTKEQLQGMAAMGLKMLEQMGQGAEIAATTRKTGNTAKVGDWNAYEVLVEIGGPIPMKINVWFSTDVGIDQQVWAELGEVMQANALFADATEQLAAFEGYPVRQTVEMSMMGTSISSSTEVTRVASKPFDTTVCAIPDGFVKVEGLPLAPPGGGSR